jgi:hypothetical protein
MDWNPETSQELPACLPDSSIRERQACISLSGSRLPTFGSYIPLEQAKFLASGSESRKPLRRDWLPGFFYAWHSGNQGKPNLNLQATRVAIGCGNFSAVEADCALGDSKSEANAAGHPATRFVQAIKRLEQFCQGVWGNAGAGIAHPQHGFGSAGPLLAPEIDFYRGSFLRVADCVAHHVLDGAMQQGRVAAHLPFTVRYGGMDMAMPCLSLELGIFDYALDQFSQGYRSVRDQLFSVLQARQRKNSANQLVKAAGLKFDPVEHVGAIDPSTLAGEPEGDIQARQWRT